MRCDLCQATVQCDGQGRTSFKHEATCPHAPPSKPGPAYSELLAIVREVAERGPYRLGLEYLPCDFCGAKKERAPGAKRDVMIHADDCLWLHARKAVGA